MGTAGDRVTFCGQGVAPGPSHYASGIGHFWHECMRLSGALSGATAGAVSGANGNGQTDEPGPNGDATASGNGASQENGNAGACRAQEPADEKRTRVVST